MTETQTLNPIDEAIQKALAQTAVVATTPASAPAPAPVGTPAPNRMSLQDLKDRVTSVDAFVKLSEAGWRTGPGKAIPSFKAIIRLSETAIVHMLRFGNPAQYERSHDGVTTVRGESWLVVQERANRIQGEKVLPYPGVEIPMELAEPTFELAAGKRVGYTTTATGNPNYIKMTEDAAALGVADNSDTPFLVEVGFDVREKNGHRWAIPTFKVLGLVE